MDEDDSINDEFIIERLWLKFSFVIIIAVII
jgi:hypothetical protein